MAILFKQIFLALFILKMSFKLTLNLLNFLNLKRRAGQAPDILKDVISPEKLRVSDSYNAKIMSFQTISFLFESLLLLLFLVTPLFEKYVNWVSTLSSFYMFQTALFF